MVWPELERFLGWDYGPGRDAAAASDHRLEGFCRATPGGCQHHEAVLGRDVCEVPESRTKCRVSLKPASSAFDPKRTPPKYSEPPLRAIDLASSIRSRRQNSFLSRVRSNGQIMLYGRGQIMVYATHVRPERFVRTEIPPSTIGMR